MSDAPGAIKHIADHHVDYDRVAASRIRARDMFEGAEIVKGKSETYLFRGQNEDQVQDYPERLNRAVFEPLAELIIEVRQGNLFRKEHSRQLPVALERWLEDADRSGTPAHAFFQRVARDAQIGGMDWVLCSKVGLRPNEDGTLPAITKADEERKGLRPFFEHIPGEFVTNWGPVSGPLEWATIYRPTVPDPVGTSETPWALERKTHEEWHVYTAREWYVYIKPEKEQDQFVLTGQGVHPCRRVPLVPWYGEFDSDRVGWSVYRKAVAHMIQAYNQMSDLDWFLRVSGHPIPWGSGAHELKILDAGKGVWLQQDEGGPTPQIGYMETSGAAYTSLMGSIQYLIGRVYAIALRQVLNDSKQVQAADTQRENRRSLNSSLMSLARHYEDAERECWENMARWIGAPEEQIAIEWQKDFDDAALASDMLSAFGGLVERRIISRETVREILREGEILPESLDLEEEKARIQEEQAEDAENFMPGFKQPGNGSSDTEPADGNEDLGEEDASATSPTAGRGL